MGEFAVYKSGDRGDFWDGFWMDYKTTIKDTLLIAYFTCYSMEQFVMEGRF